ncbi:MAG: hypothetical protein M3Y62_08035 [Candidatus Dormibacteraeota bacterium]|uniref:hypothetical protein n=1 Tax=Candidatus Dormibacter sp. TaxID=2973982 RepID=UPI000DB54CCE|nr:hypothetical protein [Candidatus Dormibacteraeota bacterium]PZR69774.1 MAG: hypothetical protein DLM66_06150 [Candidatus Dormibacteraeota bacterium]
MLARRRYHAYDERAERLTWTLSTVIQSLLAARFGLELLGLTGLPGSTLLLSVTRPLLLPFDPLKPPIWWLQDQGDPPFHFEPIVLVAMMGYGILGWLAGLLVAILSNRRPPA